MVDGCAWWWRPTSWVVVFFFGDAGPGKRWGVLGYQHRCLFALASALILLGGSLTFMVLTVIFHNRVFEVAHFGFPHKLFQFYLLKYSLRS